MWASVPESFVFCRMTRPTEGYEDDAMSWARWFERRQQMELADALVKWVDFPPVILWYILLQMKFRRFSRHPCSVSMEQCQGQSWSLFLGPTSDEANPAPQNPLVEPILPSPAVQTANNIDGASSSRRTCGKFGLCSIYFCGEFVCL